MRVPIRSFRKEVPRATAAPLMAPARWPSRLAGHARIVNDRHPAGPRLASGSAAPPPARRRGGRSPPGRPDRPDAPPNGSRSRAAWRCRARQHAGRDRVAGAGDSGRRIRRTSPARPRCVRTRPSRPREFVTPGPARAAASGAGRAVRQRRHVRLGRVGEVERAAVGMTPCSALAQAGEPVLRHHARHRHACSTRRAKPAGSALVAETMALRVPTNTRRPRSRLRALQLLDLAQAALHAERGAGHRIASAASAPALPGLAEQSYLQQCRAALMPPASRRPRRARHLAQPARAPPASGCRGTAARPRAARRPASPRRSCATVSAVGMMRPNTWICRASCSQRLPVLSSDISRLAFSCARARSSSCDLGHVAPAPCAAPPASPAPVRSPRSSPVPA